nr:MAG TPA: hypothetical protein [Caudoviricetes sp.]
MYVYLKPIYYKLSIILNLLYLKSFRIQISAFSIFFYLYKYLESNLVYLFYI